MSYNIDDTVKELFNLSFLSRKDIKNALFNAYLAGKQDGRANSGLSCKPVYQNKEQTGLRLFENGQPTNIIGLTETEAILLWIGNKHFSNKDNVRFFVQFVLRMLGEK